MMLERKGKYVLFSVEGMRIRVNTEEKKVEYIQRERWLPDSVYKCSLGLPGCDIAYKANKLWWDDGKWICESCFYESEQREMFDNRSTSDEIFGDISNNLEYYMKKVTIS